MADIAAGDTDDRKGGHIMKLLVIGGGGREHAIVWKLKENEDITQIYCAPGNAGISRIAKCVDIKATEIEKLVSFAKENEIDFTVIGPDDPLALGITDAFLQAGLSVFGPRKNAAIIEYSKAYSKELMKKYNIPTAAYEIFDDYEKALAYAKKSNHPLVIKADGLALGKGVVICGDINESEAALKAMMIDGRFGASGHTVVIEEFLTGPEVTVLAFCDGKTVVPMVSSQDHKRAFDGDEGPNTGGMGAISPSPYYTPDVAKICADTIFKPTLNALIEENRPYTGIIYFGLMLTKNGPKVIEYNSRFGDPEAQAVLPRLETDLFTILKACVEQNLDKIEIKWKQSAAVCVVLASGGYPLSYKTGYEITGLDTLENNKDLYVFQAGTALSGGKTITAGGRVLGVTAMGENTAAAAKAAYDGLAKIDFKDMHYRKDIGFRRFAGTVH